MRPPALRSLPFVAALLLLVSPGCTDTDRDREPVSGAAPERLSPDRPHLIVLGIAQDGGYPQAGDTAAAAWDDPSRRRLASCLALVEPGTGRRWMFEATPDFKDQLHRLDVLLPTGGRPGLDGIFLTHAHIGHYSGLMHLGHEAMGAQGVPVYAMPRMAEFLSGNGPWSQLVRYGNIALRPLQEGESVGLAPGLSVVPLRVPHREEYSEVVGFRITGPERSVLFLPDIDGWDDWDTAGTLIEDVLATVDLAYIDATFFDDSEIPGRDMSGFPHPRIVATMGRLGALPAGERAKVRFIHLNHSNPALHGGSAARRAIDSAGFRVADEGDIEPL